MTDTSFDIVDEIIFLENVAAPPGVSVTALKMVLLTLAAHSNSGGKNVFPSQETVARLTGLSSRQVRKAMDHLEKRQVLVQDIRRSRVRTKQFRIDTGRLPELTSGTNRHSVPVTRGSQFRSKPEVSSDKQINKQTTEQTTRSPAAIDAVAAEPTPEASANLLERLCKGFEDVIDPEFHDDVWLGDIENFQRQGFELEAHIVPGVHAALRTHRRRKFRDAVWNPIRVLHHPLIEKNIKRKAAVVREARLKIF